MVGSIPTGATKSPEINTHKGAIDLAYIRFSEIPFQSDDDRIVCEALYKSICEAEDDLINAEDLLERLSATAGKKQMIMLGIPNVIMLGKILMGLKVAFWYYSGVSPADVLDDVTDLEIIDIFNPWLLSKDRV